MAVGDTRELSEGPFLLSEGAGIGQGSGRQGEYIRGRSGTNWLDQGFSRFKALSNPARAA